MPELLWKAYIDFEITEGEMERTRQVYERLLNRTRHLKVWLSYAKFEASAGADESDETSDTNSEAHQTEQMDRVRRSRAIFERAFEHLRNTAPEPKEERAMLLEEWLGDVSIVQKKLPRKVKRKRGICTHDGSSAGFEEYIDYIFPDDVAMAPSLKILEMEYKWKKQKVGSDED